MEQVCQILALYHFFPRLGVFLTSTVGLCVCFIWEEHFSGFFCLQGGEPNFDFFEGGTQKGGLKRGDSKGGGGGETNLG